MGMYSAFVDEDDVFVHDQAFYNYLKKIVPKTKKGEYASDGFSEARAIIKYYEDNKDKKTGKLPEFTFSIFSDWKIQSYWYDSFVKIIIALIQFLDQSRCAYGTGYAKFEYEEGHPFEFMIEYKPKNIWVNYVPLTWKRMDLKLKKENELKIPKEIKQQIKESEVEAEI